MSHLDMVPPPPLGGARALVLDPALSGPLGLIAEVREFREHGVAKIYHLAADPIATDCATVAFFVRPHVALMPRLAAAARELAAARKAVTIFFVPRRSLVCERILEEERVGTGVALREFRMALIALDDDVLTLEQPCFRDLFLDGDRSVLHSIAEAVLALDAQFGVIPRLRGKGNCARQVLHIVTSMRRSLQAEGRLPPAADKPPEIGTLLLIDRDVDLVTPLCTELTYEGLLHHVFGISHGYVDLEPDVLGGQAGGRKVKREMNSNDPLYSQIRDLNFGDLGPLLNKLTHSVRDGYEERHAAHTVSQVRAAAAAAAAAVADPLLQTRCCRRRSASL